MDIVPFTFEGFVVPVGHLNSSKAMADHSKGVTKRYPLQIEGGLQEARVRLEPGVLCLTGRDLS